MSTLRFTYLMVCIVAMLGMAPHIIYSDYNRKTISEKILFKKETVDSYGEPKYVFILKESGSTFVTPQCYYSYDKGQDFRYYKGKEKADRIVEFYIISAVLSLFAIFLFGIITIFKDE